MQTKNWDDLRYLLALKRGKNLTGAARLMGVDDTTVSRRLVKIQSAMGVPLYTRQSDGSLILTSKGEGVVKNVEAMEQHFDRISETLGTDDSRAAGSVRLTSVPIVINRLLTPNTAALTQSHPDLDIELVPDARNLSLTLREADIALRLARPSTGGMKIKARRIGVLNYGIYVSNHYNRKSAKRLPWIRFDDSMSHIPQAQWLVRATKGANQAVSGLKIHDGETAIEAICAGLGKSLLPRQIAGSMSGLRELPNDTAIALPSRDLWVLAHENQMNLQRIRITLGWIEQIFSRLKSDK